MPKYLITREVPGASRLSAEELAGVAAKSNEVLAEMGAGIQWDHSYVSEDHLHCVYTAANEALIREHAARGGFPCSRVRQITVVIDPVTGGA